MVICQLARGFSFIHELGLGTFDRGKFLGGGGGFMGKITRLNVPTFLKVGFLNPTLNLALRYCFSYMLCRGFSNLVAVRIKSGFV